MRALRFVSTLSLVTATALPAFAGGGYFSGTKGARAAGRGGAFTAKADDLSAVAFNPAGLAHIGTTLIQVGNRFSYNSHSYTRAPTLDWGGAQDSGGIPRYVEFDEVDNGEPWQLLDPLLGITTNFGLKDWQFALAAYAPAGVSKEEYPVEGGQRYMMVSREAQILNYSLSAAWKLRELFGVGASLQWIAVPKLKYSLIIDGDPFDGAGGNGVSSDYDIHATTEGKDFFTFNAVIGGWYRPAPFLELGLSAQVVPADITTSSTLSVQPLDPDTVRGGITLRRGTEEANDVDVSFPLPMTFRAGARYRHLDGEKELFDVELDLTYETWSRVDQFSLDSRGLVAYVQENPVNVGNIMIDKQWQDTLTVALGGDFNVVPERFTARAGVYFETAVADDAYANIDFAGGNFTGFALGGSAFFDKFEIALAYEFRGMSTVSVSEGDARVYVEAPGSLCTEPYTDPDACNAAYLGQPGPVVNAGTYDAYSHMASLDVLYRF
ncbi:MAG TPA: outer membrane protein transport protein [Polyangiaceae bacterium]